jgi:hypothetical protein
MRFGIGGYALERVEMYGGASVSREMRAEAVLADELGFDSLRAAENHFSADRQCSSPFVIAGVLAGATQCIKLGVFAIPTIAHPPRVAEDAATLDLLSGGRLLLCYALLWYGVPTGGVCRVWSGNGRQGRALSGVSQRHPEGVGWSIHTPWQTLSNPPDHRELSGTTRGGVCLPTPCAGVYPSMDGDVRHGWG